MTETTHTTGTKTAITFGHHRGGSLAEMGGLSRALAGAPVDYAWFWDELSNMAANGLWTPETTPLSQAHEDAHSTHDPIVAAAFSLAANPELGVRMTTDAVRARPAELNRALYSLAAETRGDAEVVLALGAGEVRQHRPFGHPTGQGLSRLEDVLRLTRMLWEADEPFSFQGNHWTFDHAFIGTTRPKRPKVWALGGGAKLIDLAARYADGFETGTPSSTPDVDGWAKQVTDVKRRVERYDRDPEEFGLGVWLVTMIHDDPDVLEQAKRNNFVKAFAGMFGRFDQKAWQREGITPVMPLDWHYARDWLPFQQSGDEVLGIVSQVPREMVDRTFHHAGSVAEVTARALEFVEAGANFVGIVDVLPFTRPVEEAEEALGRWLQVCGGIKAGSLVRS